MSRLVVFVVFGLSSTLGIAQDVPDAKQRFWHQWRGPNANGVAPNANPPTTWSEDHNVLWKVPINGRGASTPIVWGDKVFLLTTIDTGKVDSDLPAPDDQPERPFGITYPNTVHQYVVVCLDRNTGEEIWRRVATEQIPNEGHHGDNSFASSSPTTDGKRLFVWFGGAGMFCFDFEGTLLWNRDLGEAKTRLSFGEAASPVYHSGRIIVTRDQEDQSYLVVLDAGTGDTIWRVDRNEPSGWSTPLVKLYRGQTQLITNGKTRVRSYDLDSGKLIWECGGQASNVTPSPVGLGDLVFCMSGYRGSALYALPLDAKGDITETDKVRWSLDRSTPYVPSPLLYDNLLYFNQSNQAVWSCHDAKTGESQMERVRLPALRQIYASPVGAAGRVYVCGRRGKTLVLEHGTTFKVLAENELDEGCDASPAIVGNQLFLRGRTHLYCLSESGR